MIGTVVGLLPKNYLRNGMRTGLHYVISLSVCCRPISLIAGAARDRFAQTGRLQERASLGYHVGLVSSHAVSSGTRSPCCGVFGGVF